MAIITLSRGCFSHGKEIAEAAAAKLGYPCISQEILLEASQFFHFPEAKLFESLHDAPGLIERFTHVRQRFIDGFQAALLEHVVKDNVVYHGFAGQILLNGIDHVLKVRVIAEMEERIKLLQSRQQIGRDEALRLIEGEDHERTEWYRTIYRIDTNDTRLYDIILHVDRLTIADASDIICQAAMSGSFRSTERSRAALADLALESHVKVAIEGVCKAEVRCGNGIVHLRVPAQKLRSSAVATPRIQDQVRNQIREDVYEKLTDIVSGIPGVKEIECTIDTPYYV